MNVIMKFGGTSVADAEAMTRVIDIVRGQIGPTTAGDRRRWWSCRRCRRSPIGSIETGAAGRARARATAPPSCSTDLLTTPRRRGVGAGQRSPRWTRSTAQLTTDFAALTRDVRALGRPARGVAALRHDEIVAMGELASSRIVAAAFAAAGRPRRVGRRAAGAGDRRRAHGGGARHGRDLPSARSELVGVADRGRPGAGAGRVHRRHGERRHDDARARRLGLFGGDLRRLPRRRRDSDLDRCRRHADGRSAGRRRSAAGPAAVVRRGVGARLFRRQGPPPEHDSSGRRQEHPGPHSEFAPAGGAPGR